jgi:DNA-binding IclR family transcriptional regulator
VAGNSTQAGRSVVNKISTILLLFNEGSEYSLTEIARLADVPLSSAQRYIAELVAAGFLRRAGRARFGAGEAVRFAGPTEVRQATLVERGPYVIDDLGRATHRRVRLGILDQRAVLYIEKVPGPLPPTAFRAAATLPAHATAIGRCLLAFAPATTVDRVVLSGLPAYTPHTMTDAGLLRAALAAARRTHIAVTGAELEPGVCGVAMPVFGAGRRVVAAIELAVRDPDECLPALLAPLTIACRSLSREIGRSAAASLSDCPTDFPPRTECS